MAEQEVIKHTKKIYNIWGDKKHNIWAKVKEFLLEIIIIVFAVSLSIWFHERSEHAHQQKEVEVFLTGLREDLRKDIREMQADKESYQNSQASFNYLKSLKLDQQINKDSLDKYDDYLFNATGLTPNDGRFEGFKSSGRLGNIENEVLQNEIVDMYVESIPTLIRSTDYYTSQKAKFLDLYNDNMARLTDSTTNIDKVLTSPAIYNRAGVLTNITEILERYNICIDKSQKIISMIDHEFRN
ncbi:hypothetical protein [Flavitalea sp.]|nr:hypothetical protein [Flavitalea sp.]